MFKDQIAQNEADERTLKRKINGKVNLSVNRAKQETSLSDVTSFMNLSVFSVPEENESNSTSEDTMKISNMREYSQHALPNYFDGFSKELYQYDPEGNKDIDKSGEEEDEESRAGLPLRLPLKGNEDEVVKHRIRDLNNKIRKYTV